MEAEAEAIFNSDIKAEAVVVLFVFNENGSGSGFFINLEAVAEAAKKMWKRFGLLMEKIEIVNGTC